MKVKQIFSTYDKDGHPEVFATYCASCGSLCEKKEDGGRLRSYCPKCGYIAYRNPAPAVSVLVTDDRNVLLGRRAKTSHEGGRWCSPCGFVEFDEDFLTAACREVKEETGLIVELKSVIQVTCNFLNPNLHSIVIVLLGYVTGGALKPGDDIDFLQWFPMNGPFPEFAFEADKEIIERYVATQIKGLPIQDGFQFVS